MKWTLDGLADQVRAACEIDPSGCWLWRYGSWADRDYARQREYPRLMISGRRQHVSRWVMEAKAGPAPDMEPCHSCDRPECVSPDHLHWGTHRENMIEMAERQRTGSVRHPERYRGRVIANPARGEAHWARKDPGRAADVFARRVHGSVTHPEKWVRGEAIPWSKLTAEKVRLIRQRLARGETPVMIAPDFGVGRGTIRAIAEGRSWKHVT